MAVTVLAPAGTWFLTTLDRLKNELGITTDESDTILTDQIDRASTAIADECRRVFGVQQYVETLKGTNAQLLQLSQYPVNEVTEVREDSDVITDYTVEDGPHGILWRQAGWGRGMYGGWDAIAYSSGYISGETPDTYRYMITYRAGYVLPGEQNLNLPPGTLDVPNLPGLVEQACLETVKQWFVNIDGLPPVVQMQVNNLRITYAQKQSKLASPGSLPDEAYGYLKNYMKDY